MSIRDVPSLATYEQARERWASTKPWRGDDTYHQQTRPLGLRRDRRVTISSTDVLGSQVVCRLYNTRCVVYNSDGTIEINGWPSKSTMTFIDNLVGMHARPLHFCNAYLVRGGGVVSGYDIKIMPTGNGAPAEVLKSKPFTFHKLNRQKTNTFFKSLRWGAFRTWALTAYDILNGDLEALYAAAVEAFPETHVIGGFEYHYPPSVCRAGGQQLVAALRKSIHHNNICQLRDTEEVAYCTSYDDYLRRVRADRRAS
jgi:hypothetical protein